MSAEENVYALPQSMGGVDCGASDAPSTVASTDTRDSPEPTVRTRSGRVIKKPKQYSPKEVCDDDFNAVEYDSYDELDSPGSSIEYDSDEGGSSQDEYDSEFVAGSDESVEESEESEDEETADEETADEETEESEEEFESESENDEEKEYIPKKRAKKDVVE
jgi:hypothetical protein